MRKFLLTGWIVGTILAAAPMAGAADAPRAIIERAVSALGGKEAVRQSRAVFSKMTGSIYLTEGEEKEKRPFTAELYTQDPDRFKLVLHVDILGQMATMIQTLDRDHVWLLLDDQDDDSDAGTLPEMRLSAYVDDVASLLPLLEDSRFQLSTAGEANVEGKPANVVRVSSTGHPDVLLFFDQASNLMVKTEYRRHEQSKKLGDREVLKEEFLGDYRLVDLEAPDVKLLQAAKVGTDDASLVAFLRAQIMDDAQRERVQGLIRKLGDTSFEVREAAQAQLLAIGPAALPLLSRATQDADPEIASRAKECQQRMGKPPDPSIAAAVVRLLAVRRVPGATEVLLAYLPSVSDVGVAEEVESALSAVGFVDGKPAAALEKAQSELDAERKAVAGRLLHGEMRNYTVLPGQRLYPRGLKQATTGVQYKDGKKSVEWKVAETQYFKQLADRIFVKP